MPLIPARWEVDRSEFQDSQSYTEKPYHGGLRDDSSGEGTCQTHRPEFHSQNPYSRRKELSPQAILCYAITQVHLHACTCTQIKSSVTKDGVIGTIKQTYLFNITKLNIFIEL